MSLDRRALNFWQLAARKLHQHIRELPDEVRLVVRLALLADPVTVLLPEDDLHVGLQVARAEVRELQRVELAEMKRTVLCTATPKEAGICLN